MASHGTLTKTLAPSWERLEAAAARYGPSFYLADLRHFVDNFRHFLDVFRTVYPRSRIGYSLKTNYLPPFVLRAHDLGAYAEVVSRFEFDFAQELGVPGERIIFNGPVKQPEDLTHAFAAGAMVNADSVHELWNAIRIAERSTAPITVGIRCSLGPVTPDSRFGIDLTKPDAGEALAALDATPKLRIGGLHCHHSSDRSAERYRDRTRAMVAVHQDVLGHRPLDYIDIGGGFASHMPPELAAQMPSSVSTFEDYAAAVAVEMHRAYGDDGPELILEPGMALLADTMVFVTRVQTVKEVAERKLAVVDGQVFNVKPLRAKINQPIDVVPAPHQATPATGPWDVVGQTCMEVDTLHTGYIGPIGIGDYVVVENVGAYTNVLNAPFIRGTPPIVELDGDGPGDLLRPQSTVGDLARSYEVAG